MRWIVLLATLFHLATAIAQGFTEDLEEARLLLRSAPQESISVLQTLAAKVSVQTTDDQLEFLRLNARAYREIGELAASEQFAERMLLLAKENDIHSSIASALREKAEIHYTSGQYAEAEVVLRKSLNIYVRAELNREIAIIQQRLSAAVRSQGRYWEAIDLAQRARVYFEETEDSVNLASVYSSIGLAHDHLGNYAQALEALQITLSMDMANGREDAIADVLYNIASVYVDMQDWIQAKDYLLRALEIDEKAGFKNNVAYDHYRLAAAEKGLGNFDSALDHIATALSLFEDLGSVRNRGWALIMMGRIHSDMKSFSLATDKLEQGTALAREAGDRELVTTGTMHLAQIKLALENYEETISLLKVSLQDAKQRGDPYQMQFIYGLLVNAFEKRGDTQQALDTMKDMVEEEDKRDRELRAQTIAQLQNNIQVQAQQHEMTLLEKDKALADASAANARYQRNVWLAGAAILIVFAILIVRKERQKHEMAKLKEQLLTEAAERKNALLADVSHELRTPLTVLGLQVEMLEHDLADNPQLTYLQLKDKIKQLNTLINDVYELSKTDVGATLFNFETHSVLSFLHNFETQICPMVKKAGLQLSFELTLDPGVQVNMDQDRIKQVLTNLIRNSISYTDKPGEIKIVSYLDAGNWTVAVHDTAPSVKEEECTHLFERLYRCEKSRSKDTGGSGLGLAICRSLVEAHQGEIKATISPLGGVCITFVLPIQQTVSDTVVMAKEARIA